MRASSHRHPAVRARRVRVPLARRRLRAGRRRAAAARAPPRREARAAGARGRRDRGGRATAVRLPRRGQAGQRASSAFGRRRDGRRALDVGASTGGFTDCLLQHGAAHVVAVDVAYGELDWRLRSDDRVTVIERTNARALAPEDLPYRPELIVIDVSFISLAKVLPGGAGLRGRALRLPGHGQAAVRGRPRRGGQGRRGPRRRRAPRGAGRRRCGRAGARRVGPGLRQLGPARAQGQPGIVRLAGGAGEGWRGGP